MSSRGSRPCVVLEFARSGLLLSLGDDSIILFGALLIANRFIHGRGEPAAQLFSCALHSQLVRYFRRRKTYMNTRHERLNPATRLTSLAFF